MEDATSTSRQPLPFFSPGDVLIMKVHHGRACTLFGFSGRKVCMPPGSATSSASRQHLCHSIRWGAARQSFQRRCSSIACKGLVCQSLLAGPHVSYEGTERLLAAGTLGADSSRPARKSEALIAFCTYQEGPRPQDDVRTFSISDFIIAAAFRCGMSSGSRHISPVHPCHPHPDAEHILHESQY